MVFAAGSAYGDPSPQTSAPALNEPWLRTIDLVKQGDFKGATKAIKQISTDGELIEQVRTWLQEYEAKQAARKELDRSDFEKYVGYAKVRIERKEYREALGWALAALDCADDRDAFLSSDWLLNLVNESLAAADKLRQEGEWRKTWQIYSQLSALYERESRYQKLAHEAATHVRLDTMFKEESHWEERIEKVRWKTAEKALEFINLYYVEPADFKQITESGLEQVLLLADSKAAQEVFDGLGSNDDRKDFTLRVQEHLKQVRTAPRVDAKDCVKHFRRVVNKINPETVQLPEALLVNELMRGALEPLDDFTTVIWPKASKEFEKHTRGDFVGVGISISKNPGDEIEVVTPLEDTPAYRAGIQAGDVITKVDGESIKGFSINKVVETITGPEGTSVRLTIRRNDEEIEFPLVRETVKIRSVKGVRRDSVDEERWDHWLDRNRGIAYIRIMNFQKNTAEDVENVLAELPGLRGLILDLRRNPGGLLDSAWQISSLFLKRDDTVVSTKGRIKSEDQTFHALSEGAYSDIPLVVLVDERSASASEIVSGSVRDNRQGTVVGERTFGKFSVQNLIPLGRSGAKLKITTARYYLPNGDSLHRDPTAETWGVMPDIPVRLVRWETYNVYQMQREANLLGPPKVVVKKEEAATASQDDTKTEQTKADGDVEAQVQEKTDRKVGPTKTEEEAVADAGGEASTPEGDKAEEDKLPLLKQPDENNRPKEDPQLDTALLLLRVTLTGELQPTLAAAEVETAKESAKP